MKVSKIFMFVLIYLLFNACISNSPKDNSEKTAENKFDALMQKTVELYESEKWEEFVGQAETLIEESGKDYGFYTALSHAYSMLNNFDKAIDYAEKALNNDPNDYFALLLLGNYSLNIEDYEAAEHFYLSSLRRNPNYARAYINLAVVYKQQNKNILAIENLEKAISLFSKNGFKDEVVSLSNEILKLDPDNQFAKENLKENTLIYK